MDKSWIDSSTRMTEEYWGHLDRFLEFAYASRSAESYINCPCRKCVNRYYFSRDVVRTHLRDHGFWKDYRIWTLHGESNEPLDGNQENEESMNLNIGDDMMGMIHEAQLNPHVATAVGNAERTADCPQTGCDEETKKYLKLLEDAQTKLFPGCENFTSLSFTVRLLHMKVINKSSDKSLDMLLELLNEAFPEVKIPSSYYHARKLTNDLGFTYETWDACPNHCMLFRNDDANLDACSICKTSRWKVNADASINGKGRRTKIAAQRMRYFPLKPSLQRLFMCSKTAKFMTWHAEAQSNDEVFRHPADSPTWKDFDKRHPEFASDSRNVRLGLASDGFNPFGTMHIVHSTWPVVLIPYNLPPWLCMKQSFFMLSVLIDGPKGPGDKIDVYLQPLIEELKELWNEGVHTFDASTRQMFQMHACLLWTINDFPAYANLSGWSTKGEFACPYCSTRTVSHWLKHSRKQAYMGHRRFLPSDNKFRKDKVSFDGTREWQGKPKVMSGSEQLNMLESEGILTEYKRDDLLKREEMKKKRKRPEPRSHNWKKKSIFFELPYWKDNLIRHNLDVMHIEKNVCDNVLWTILGTGKSKDGINARRDLQELNIRKMLHPQPRGPKKAFLPPTNFTMNNEEKDKFLKVLKEVRVPDGYASNIAKRVRLQDRSIGALKSHDNHILLQQLIPLAIRKSLPKKVVEALIELSNFFRQLYSKVNRAEDLKILQDRIPLTLFHLEKIFPPAFFDVMEHLPIHLTDEALLGGAVQFRSMYQVERYLLTLKQYVRNRACPEGSIAKGYVMEHCMNFCSWYLDDVETKCNRPMRNCDGDDDMGRGMGEEMVFELDDKTWIQAHRYVLFNTESVEPFVNQHLELLKRTMPRADDHQIRREHFKEFHNWFKDHILGLRETTNVIFSDEILNLAMGPHVSARRFKGYILNGICFRVKATDDIRATQNCGVALKADTVSYSSQKDKNPRVGAVYYYGQLTDIVQIRYTNDIKHILFKCDWVNNIHSKMEDAFKFTLVNFNHLLYQDDQPTNEPFILASQAEQVWYVPDPEEPDWKVVVKMCQRGLYDINSSEPEIEPFQTQVLEENAIFREEEGDWVREGEEGVIVDVKN